VDTTHLKVNPNSAKIRSAKTTAPLANPTGNH
jgi:hypothetical protein